MKAASRGSHGGATVVSRPFSKAPTGRGFLMRGARRFPLGSGFWLFISVLVLSGCTDQATAALNGWREVPLPEGCVAKQVARSGTYMVIVLCQDGRVFHN
jgi:hypothetical protein